MKLVFKVLLVLQTVVSISFADTMHMTEFVVESSISADKLVMECETENPAEWDINQFEGQDKKDYMLHALAVYSRMSQQQIDQLFQKNFEEITKLYENSDISKFNITSSYANYKDCGLSGLEKYSINLYTGGEYRAINAYLRAPQKDESKQYIDLVVMYAKKGLEKYKAYTKSVKRGSSLSEEVLAQHQVGQIVTYKGFTSTTTNSPWSGHQFIILSKSGRVIAPMSKFYGEAEVLFLPDTQFLVIKRESNGFYFTITMIELTVAEVEQHIKSKEQSSDQMPGFDLNQVQDQGP